MAKDETAPPRLPKRIAGIKLPKELRKSAEPLLAIANKPLVADTLAAAMLAAAAALAERKDARGVAKAAGLGAGIAAVKSVKGANRLGLALAIALGEVAAAAASNGVARPEKRGKGKKRKTKSG